MRPASLPEAPETSNSEPETFLDFHEKGENEQTWGQKADYSAARKYSEKTLPWPITLLTPTLPP